MSSDNRSYSGERGSIIDAIKDALRSCEVRTTASGRRELVLLTDRPSSTEAGEDWSCNLTDRLRRVIELADVERDTLGHQWLGTEHLVLGLLADGECVGAALLAQLDCLPSLQEARGMVLKVVGGRPDPSTSSEERVKMRDGVDYDAFLERVGTKLDAAPTESGEEMTDEDLADALDSWADFGTNGAVKHDLREAARRLRTTRTEQSTEEEGSDG